MNRRFYNRDVRGYALISVIVISCAAVAFLMAIGSSLLAVSRSQAVLKSKAGLTTAAITARDHVLALLNESLATNNPIDVTQNEKEKVFNYHGTDLGLDPEIDVSVKLKLLDLTADQRNQFSAWGLLAMPFFNSSTSKDWSNPTSTVSQSDYIRVLEATARRGSFRQSVRSTLVPSQPAKTQEELDEEDQPRTALFSSGAFAVSSMTFAPRTSNGKLVLESWNTDASNSDLLSSQVLTKTDTNGNIIDNSFSLEVRSNQTAALGHNTALVGNLVVSNNTLNAPNNIATANGSAIVLGRVITNGGTNSSLVGSVGNTAQPSDNVLALADSARGNSSNNPFTFEQTVERSSDNIKPTTFIANSTTPLEPASAALSATDRTSSLASQLAASTSDEFSHQLNDNDEEISAFKVGQLNTTDGIIEPFKITDANQEATKIFVTGDNSKQAILLNSEDLQNLTGDPRSLQIFYSGSGLATINISNLADFNGLIYAPNATIKISGDGNFNGAIVGRNINVQLDGRMRLMNKDELAVQQAGGVIDVDYETSRRPYSVASPIQNSNLKYYAATHEELTGALVPIPD